MPLENHPITLRVNQFHLSCTAVTGQYKSNYPKEIACSDYLSIDKVILVLIQNATLEFLLFCLTTLHYTTIRITSHFWWEFSTVLIMLQMGLKTQWFQY